MIKVKNIVIVSDYAYVDGGASNVAIESAIMLAKQYNVYFFAGSGTPCNELHDDRIKVISLKMPDLLGNDNKISAIINGIYNRKAAIKFKDLLVNLDAKETIVHFHTWTKVLSSSIFSVTRKLGFKSILTMHDYFSVCPNGGLYNYKKEQICDIKPMSVKCIACNCDKRSYYQKIWRVIRQLGISKNVIKNKNLNLLYISDFSFSKIKVYLSAHNVYNVKNPYNLGKVINYKAETLNDYLYVGRLSDEKGADIFCEALSRLLETNKIRGKAIIVGSGELQQKLEKKYPFIKFEGWKNKQEISNYISISRALIFPSKWYETAGLTPIEFMSHGIPCIVSDNCAAVEYIDNENNGLLFENRNVQDLINKVLYAENNENWTAISRQLRNSFDRNEYSSEQHYENIVRIYDEIINM